MVESVYSAVRTDSLISVALTEVFPFFSSPNIVRVIKSRRMGWAGHVERMGEERECIGS